MWNVPRAPRQFAWPLWSGTVTSGFGMRHGTMHDGVDIAAPVGTTVHAADSGVVAFAGKLNGYGNTVIIRHSDNYVTVYGHNSRILVSEGSPVARGQSIAEVGTSGRTTGPNLHFEVRYDNHRLQSARAILRRQALRPSRALPATAPPSIVSRTRASHAPGTNISGTNINDGTERTAKTHA